MARSGRTLLWHVVLPQLRPVTFIAAMVCVVSALRSFDLVMIMTAGGPYNSTTVLAYYMYEQTFLSLRYGYAAAIAAVLFALMGCCVALLPLAASGAGEGLMFPAPIERAPRTTRFTYRAALYVSLAIWLLPMAGVALTSVRSIDDLNRGNLWGWPSEFRLVENYAAVFADRTWPSSSSTACSSRFRPLWERSRSPAWQALRSPNTAFAAICPVCDLHRWQSRAVPDPDDPGARPDDRDRDSTTRAGR